MMQELSLWKNIGYTLYGKRALSDESNKHTSISVQEYLIKTKQSK